VLLPSDVFISGQLLRRWQTFPFFGGTPTSTPRLVIAITLFWVFKLLVESRTHYHWSDKYVFYGQMPNPRQIATDLLIPYKKLVLFYEYEGDYSLGFCFPVFGFCVSRQIAKRVTISKNIKKTCTDIICTL
jgi:hypothetical protein